MKQLLILLIIPFAIYADNETVHLRDITVFKNHYEPITEEIVCENGTITFSWRNLRDNFVLHHVLPPDFLITPVYDENQGHPDLSVKSSTSWVPVNWGHHSYNAITNLACKIVDQNTTVFTNEQIFQEAFNYMFDVTLLEENTWHGEFYRNALGNQRMITAHLWTERTIMFGPGDNPPTFNNPSKSDITININDVVDPLAEITVTIVDQNLNTLLNTTVPATELEVADIPSTPQIEQQLKIDAAHIQPGDYFISVEIDGVNKLKDRLRIIE